MEASSQPTMVNSATRDVRKLKRTRSAVDLIGSEPALVPSLPLPLKEDEKDAMKRRAFAVQGIVSKEEPGEEVKEEGDSSEGGMRARYKELLKSDPGNPLHLKTYGKFLCEVEGDVQGAEECYLQATLLSPGDGEVLMLYGKLLWENYRDKERAEAFLERATEVSPNDSCPSRHTVA